MHISTVEIFISDEKKNYNRYSVFETYIIVAEVFDGYHAEYGGRVKESHIAANLQVHCKLRAAQPQLLI